MPRKLKIKAQKDALKLSTAYRADVLLGDIVKAALRGTPQDVQRVSEAAAKFIRTVRERRQDGATLLVSSNGRGRIDVQEQTPSKPPAPPAAADQAPRAAAVAPSVATERFAALDRRVAQLEERLGALQAQVARVLALADVAGPGVDERKAARGPRGTAVEAFAEGLRKELRARADRGLAAAAQEADRCARAAALAAEAESLLGAPREGVGEKLQRSSAQAAARQTALQRIAEELDFYDSSELPVAEKLMDRLEESGRVPDCAPWLEPVVQAVAREAHGTDAAPREAWLRRAAMLCGWTLIEPALGAAYDEGEQQALDGNGGVISRVASPGVLRADGAILVRARVLLAPAAAALPQEPGPDLSPPRPLPDGVPDVPVAPAAPETLPPPVLQSAPPAAEIVSDEEFEAGRVEPEAPADRETREADGARDAAAPAPAEAPREEAAPPPGDAAAATSTAEPEPASPRTEPIPQPPKPVMPFGDLTDGEIRPDEAAAAAEASATVAAPAEDAVHPPPPNADPAWTSPPHPAPPPPPHDTHDELVLDASDEEEVIELTDHDT